MLDFRLKCQAVSSCEGLKRQFRGKALACDSGDKNTALSSYQEGQYCVLGSEVIYKYFIINKMTSEKARLIFT